MINKKKKVIFISGSSSGIGFHLAKLFQQLGYIVLINGHNKKRLNLASSLLNNCPSYFGDITDRKVVEKIILNIKKKYDYIDLLVCNYGNSNFAKNNANYKFAFENNFFPTVNLINYSKKILKKNISKILCISSICGVESIKNAPIGYSLAKSTLNFYIKLISPEFAKLGITINGIVPGNIYFKGSTWDKKIKKNKSIIKKYIKENVPTNTFGDIDDIFSVCKMIISNKSNFMTGSLFTIDGSQTKSI